MRRLRRRLRARARRRAGTGRVVAIGMVRDEEDILPETAGHMASQVDEVVVLDNRSRDSSRAILESLEATVIDDPDLAYEQSAKLTRLARSLDADWVVPFDADEMWLATGGSTVAEVLGSLPAEAMVCEAEVYNHVPTAMDPAGPPVKSIGHRRPRPTPHRKVACRITPTLTIGMGAHSADYGELALKADGLLEVRHFPYRTAEQMIRKIRNGAEAIAAAERGRAAGAHWREHDRFSDEELRRQFEAFHFSADGTDLVYDPCPSPAAPR